MASSLDGTGGAPPALELRHVAKRFGGVLANDDVSFAAAAGTIHALVGENGAGKTTAMRIAFGLLAPDRGEVAVDGVARSFAGPRDAVLLGIGMVHQHFALVDAMTVTENVVLGAEPGPPWAMDLAAASHRVATLARELALPIDPAARVAELSVAERQRAELLKALYRQARVLILDEPTTVLAPPEVAALFAVLRRMRGQGHTVVLITHRLSEVLAVADAVTVMRDGRVVAARPVAGLGAAELARLIVGRQAAGNAAPSEMPPRVRKAPARPGAPVLAVRGLTVATASGTGGTGGRLRLDGVSFEVRAGEILGIAGVEGNGQTELIETLAGLTGAAAGEPQGTVMLAVEPKTPEKAPENSAGAAGASGTAGAAGLMDLAGTGVRRRRELGIAHVPEDRQRRGLVMDLDLRENSILGAHDRAPAAIGPCRAWLDRPAIARRAAAILARFAVRPAVLGLPARALSGGNQQRLVVGRELSPPPRLLLAAQPTRGVDLGGSALIHRQILALRDAGCAVLLVSSELEELMALADRLLVLHRGQVVGELDPARATAEQVGLLMTGEAAG
ncbi:MAG: ABC transporter ATP-binding protein [Acidobacteria bacterium]|nr:ABC transporter ATP-binding protein [Acidobacteriota bacterium]